MAHLVYSHELLHVGTILTRDTAPMDDSLRFLKVHAQYRIVICTQCRFAVVPSHIKEHLRKHHRHLPLEQRRELIRRVYTLFLT